MKKKNLVLTLFVLSALLLAACGGGGGGNQTPGIPTLPDTPGAGGETTPGGDLATTPGAGEAGTTPPAGETPAGGLETTPTLPGGPLGEETPTTAGGAAGDTTATPAGGAVDETPTTEATEAGAAAVTTGTPSAGLPGEAAQLELLTDILQVNITGQTGEQLGTVEGVLVDNGIPVTGSGDSGTTGSTIATPAAGGGGMGDTTVTPAAGDTGAGGDTTATPASGDTGGVTMGTASTPQVTYLLVSVDELSGSGAGTGAAGTTPTAGEMGDTTATPAAGDMGGTTATPGDGGDAGGGASGVDSTITPTAGQGEVLVPWQAFTVDTMASGGISTMTLNTDGSALASAPTFSEDMLTGETGIPGWDSAVAEYWSNQGLSIPATGAAAEPAGQPVLIRDSEIDMNVTDQNGQSIGQVSDFVVDLTTGELVYAVLTGVDAMSGQFYAVPFDHLSWESSTASGSASLGELSFNLDAAALEGAPSVSSVDEFDWSDTTELDAYWQGLNGNLNK